ncbi:enoyl-CoA delta isomerase 1, mitochondrial [Trichonephila clavipes]|nr:enoyl-CoA delta isomerase 1, mitochondrial [Trichonephila clavipes]
MKIVSAWWLRYSFSDRKVPGSNLLSLITPAVLREPQQSWSSIHRNGNQAVPHDDATNKAVTHDDATYKAVALKPAYLFSKLSPFVLNYTIKVGNLSSVRHVVSVIEDEKKGTARVVLQRPPVNALSLELLEKLTTAIKDLEERKFRGFILASDSPKVFCSGLDINELYKPPEEKLKVYWKAFQNLWKTLYSTPLITIAAVNNKQTGDDRLGRSRRRSSWTITKTIVLDDHEDDRLGVIDKGHAPAGGCVLTLSCDHSIMVKSGGFIGLNETLLGFAAPKWVQSLLVNACDIHKAEHALKTSALFTTKEALEYNIVNELVDSSSDLLPKAEEVMDKFLTIPVFSFTRTKLSMRKPFVDDLISYQEQDTKDVVGILLRNETQNVMGKYLEGLKRKKK